MIKNKRYYKEYVLGWFDRAMLNMGNIYINLYFSPLNEAWRELVKEGILKEEKLGNIYVGISYKGCLFKVEYGPGDCEERLVYCGKI